MTPIIKTLILYTSVQNLAQNVAINTESAKRRNLRHYAQNIFHDTNY